MALCSSGSHVVAPQEVYGGTWALLTNQLARFGVTTSFVDMTDPAAVQLALRPETAVVWGEVLANPSMTVTDLPAIAAIASSAGIPFVVDATFASPVICRPIEHGADLVVHSATKYFGGHSDVTGGVVVGTARPDRAGARRADRPRWCARSRRRCAAAARAADAAAAGGPAVRDGARRRDGRAGATPRSLRVDYPGLPEHQGHALANKLFDQRPLRRHRDRHRRQPGRRA